jgi:protein-disulfide isomerase
MSSKAGFITELRVAGLLVPVMFAAAVAGAEEGGARKALLLANLKVQFPQLENLSIKMGDITPTEFAGLDQGSFTIESPRGSRPQKFLVSRNNKKLYMVTEPVDVSLSEKEIAARIAKTEADKAKADQERMKQLKAAIVGLPTRGKPDAPVTIIEFSDFQCPYCSRAANTMEEIGKKYPNGVKFVFKHFPLNFHPWARTAAIASHIAGKQKPEAFWILYDKYFENQRSINPGNVVARSREYLAGSGIDVAAWAASVDDKNSKEYKAASAAVDADIALGQKFGVSGTPAFFVNGTFLNGAQPIAAFEPLIEAGKASAARAK